jgi:hypothetical protein
MLGRSERGPWRDKLIRVQINVLGAFQIAKLLAVSVYRRIRG